MTCTICGTPMISYKADQTTHPGCEPISFSEPTGQLDTETHAIKRELSDLILWADHTSERSLQVGIGPSELGDPCDRKLAYKIAGTDTINEYDPWPAIVGTSIHSWLEQAINRYQNYTQQRRYLTEQVIYPDGLVIGHSDVYDAVRKMIIDWKTVSSKNLIKFRDEGPPDSYITQINLYGLGQRIAGRDVEKVCLVALPRAGWLSDMYVWVDNFNEQIARTALDRMYRIGRRLIDLDIINQPQRWVEIEPTPSRLCGWCPYYRQGPSDGQGANDRGCPGW